MSHAWIPSGGFFTDKDFDFEARIVLGQAATGIGDAGLVFATLDKIADGDRQSWFDAWTATAAGLAAQGHQAAKDGHMQTARWALLAGATYYTKALAMVDGLADQSVLLPTFREHRACWEAYIDASQGSFVRVPVPYEDTTLPGYLLRPDTTGTPRPTFVMTNGSDESLTSLLSSGGAEALSRGWNVFAYDGPGQQSMLFERGVPFRYDWEAVLTPVIDALVAAVADPGVVDVSTSWTSHLPQAMLALLHTGQKDAFNEAMAPLSSNPEAARTMAFRGKPYQISDYFDLFTAVEQYQVRDMAGKITTPLLILDPQDEQFWPGQPKQLYDLVPGKKEIFGFTREQGANFHCQPMGRHLTSTLMLDWLADQLSESAPAPSQESQVQS